MPVLSIFHKKMSPRRLNWAQFVDLHKKKSNLIAILTICSDIVNYISIFTISAPYVTKLIPIFTISASHDGLNLSIFMKTAELPWNMDKSFITENYTFETWFYVYFITRNGEFSSISLFHSIVLVVLFAIPTYYYLLLWHLICLML